MTTSSELVTLNDWSDYWFYQIGVNVIAADTKRKVTYEKWEQWENTAMSDELHEEHKQKGDYNKGIAVIPGLLWRGPHKGMYLVAIDLDNKKTIEEFCKDGLERLKEVTLVEQNSNPDKMHLYFIVEKEIANKASDKTDISKSSMVNTNEIPAIEVKSNGKGIMFCSNSPHKDGGNYEIKGTVKPNVFNAQDVETRIKNICNKFGLYYGSSNNGRNSNNSNSTGGGIGDNNNNDSYLISIQELFTPGTKILEGHNRHLAILRVMESLLLKNMGFLKLEEIKRLAEERNQDLCIPPLEKSDIDRQ